MTDAPTDEDGDAGRPATASDRDAADARAVDDRSSEQASGQRVAAVAAPESVEPQTRVIDAPTTPHRTSAIDEAAEARTAAPAAPAVVPVETPAAAEAPPAKRGNRLVATFWVLFAALLFEVLYILVIALLVALLDGPSQVSAELPVFFRTPYITWIPVVLFAVLYEAAVLILGRAGRFAYVVASLIVGLLVWIVSAQLFGLLQSHALPAGPLLARTLESPEFVLIGVLAREVMLWTGYAVGARGKRVRRANRRARDEYTTKQRADARG